MYNDMVERALNPLRLSDTYRAWILSSWNISVSSQEVLKEYWSPVYIHNCIKEIYWGGTDLS